jgi:membrane-associated phospholipid phosphatase
VPIFVDMILMHSQPALAFSESILRADYWLLLKINKEWSSPVLDPFFLLMREQLLHIPLYLFLFVFLVLNFGPKGWWLVAMALLLIGVCDLLSSKVIKEIFDRPRPCRNEDVQHQIRFIARYCGMNGSFISSHASNHFAAAMFIFQTLKFMSRWTALMFVWAGLISYAQIYVGVHFPSDVIAGAIFGAGLGYGFAQFFNRKMGLVNNNT